MKNISFSRLLAALLLLVVAAPKSMGQTQPADPECINSVSGGIIPRSAFITYGSGIKMKSQTRRTKLTIGQTVVGSSFSPTNEMNFGYWSGFLVAPFPPFVKATQGELLDRIQISWAPNPLGPLAVGGFKIYRDGVYLAQVDKTTRNYNDFNVIAGRPYNYEVRGLNAYGEGSGGKALGFQVPNGVVTGWVRTQNDNPVPNALVTLMPMQGYSAYFGTQDGAYAKPDTSTNNYFVSIAENNWAMTFWIKSQQTAGDPLVMAMKNTGSNALTLQALNNGIQVNAGGATLTGAFATGVNGWHHVTLNYSDGQYRLYLDGILMDLNSGLAIEADELAIGKRASNDTWEGRLDELRIYHKRIDELDIPEIMEGTASSLTEGLKYYWKMDEEQGTKSFDVLNRNKLFFCGAVFSNDRPPVRTSGMTNEDGYYRIESASYGTGITFLAEPMKFFYAHRAVKFDRAEMDNYAKLPDFSVTPKATLETWINSAGPDGLQTILAKKWNGSNSFQLQLQANGVDNNILFRLNGQVQDFGLLGLGYHHLAFNIDSSATGTQVTAYKDGVLLGTALLPAYSGNWSEPTQDWTLGALKSGTDLFEQYGGLIDELAFYDTTLSQASILSHFQNSRDPQERGLRVYFSMDEGNGNRLNNSGSVLLTDQGMTFGTEWTVMAPNQSTKPHEFAPATRQVTLNPSVTSVDQVDFRDRSTIPVSGFVRYKGTDCFAKNVEILVNGESYSPPIYTDTTGKFIVDLEPGATLTLEPIFEDHEFVPAIWDVTNLTSPIAGIVFNDITTRKISGIVAGGDCKLSILSNPDLPSGTLCAVEVRSIDGCFTDNQKINNADGEYEFLGLPPIEFTVAVTKHSDPTIKAAFQAQGGKQVDLRIIPDTIVDFIYYAPPQVEIVSGLEPYSDSIALPLYWNKVYFTPLGSPFRNST